MSDKSVLHMKPSLKLTQGKFAVGQGKTVKTGNFKIEFEWGP